MKNFLQLKLVMEVAIDGILVNEISKELIFNIKEIFNF